VKPPKLRCAALEPRGAVHCEHVDLWISMDVDVDIDGEIDRDIDVDIDRYINKNIDIDI